MAITKNFRTFVPKKPIKDMTQLVVTVNDNAMLPQLRTAIRQLRGVEKVRSVRNASVCNVGKLRQELTNRLDSLSKLHDGWDGTDSKAIDRRCIVKLRSALNKATERQLSGWVLFPDARGYLYFDYTGEHGTAGITMTGDTLISFVQKGDTLEKNDGIPFTTASFISILKNVNA